MKKIWMRAAALIMAAVLIAGCSKPNNQGAGNTPDVTDGPVTVTAEYNYYHELNVPDDNYRTYYEVFLYSFCDSDGDGIGDINGLISKLDYINDGDPNTDTDLGFNGIWLMPIMPSTTYHKYDVVDYYDIDKEYGTLDDFKRLIEECNKRGIKLIIDFVMNHSSTQNLWFQEAGKYLESLPKDKEPDISECPYVEYYNFVKGDPGSNTYSRVYNSDWYYECMFWDQMPDLNLACEPLRRELEKIVDFWLDLGVGGFRLDAAKEYYSGSNEKNIDVLTWFADYVKGKDPDAYIVAEVWDSYRTYTQYYKSGIDSCFNFAFAKEDGKITKVLRNNTSNTAKSFGEAMITIQDEIKKNNEQGIDAPFLSNHDTTRAANFLTSDVTKIKMAAGMSLLMGGSAFVYYGEEIGMRGSGRDENKRAPMYWTDEASPDMCNGPIDMENVEHKFGSLEDQMEDPLSIYNYYKMAVRLRNENPEIARGTVSYMNEITDESVCAVEKSYENSSLYILYNITDQEKTVAIDRGSYPYEGIRGYLSTNGETAVLDGDDLLLPPYSIVILK